jgi:hypothetical protein
VSNSEYTVVTEIELFEFTGLTSLDVFVCGWIKSEVYKRNVDALVESFSCILDAATCAKNNKSQPIRRLLDLRMSCKQH